MNIIKEGLMPTQNDTTRWVGWVYFAGILLVVRAFFQAFLGIVALASPTFFVVTTDNLAVFNFTAWGWVHLVMAVILLTAGFSLFHGGIWGRVVGVVLTALALIANLVFLPAYPIWCVAAIVIDLLVLYALVVHGNEARV
jgi:hypothetical protein